MKIFPPPRLPVICLTLLACARTAPPAAAPAPPKVMHYDDPAMWLCRPDLPGDTCRRDLDVTELRPDGSRVVVPFVPATDPDVDCFYVYPTVDVGMIPGNHDDFSDTAPMREFARSQAARFGQVCRVFAPLYRQVTIATYFAPREEREGHFALAFSDVLAAFRWYLDHAAGTRKVVLLGHSQGAEMTVRLLRAVFDDDASMRARLLVAMPIGADVDVPQGQTTGGTLAHIPPCSSADQLGCVVAYRTYRVGHPHSWDGPPPAGRRTVCVNPVDAGSDEVRRFSYSVLPTRSKYRAREGMPGADVATTAFIALPDFYSAQCMDGKDGYRYLGVEATPRAGDTRTNPVDFGGEIWRSPLGLHLLDFQLAQGDLVEMVKRRARSP